MDKLKLVFQHTMMISFGILAGISVQGIIFHKASAAFQLQWYHPLSIIVAGFLCSLPSLLLGNEGKMGEISMVVRVIIHCLSLFIIIMCGGYFVNWYHDITGAIAVAIEFFFVYGFVWLANAWIGVMNQNTINKALDSIRDEE